MSKTRDRFERMRWSIAAGGRYIQGTPFRWVTVCHARDLAPYIGSDKKLLDHRTSKACNLVKSGSSSLKFLRKPSLVLLYRYIKNRHRNLQKKIHSAIPWVLKQRKEAIYWLVFVLFLPFDLIKAGATQTETSLLNNMLLVYVWICFMIYIIWFPSKNHHWKL